MRQFLGFDFFVEQNVSGMWTGYGTNSTVKLPIVTAQNLSDVYLKFESQALIYHCQADMGASWVYYRSFGVITYVNLPARKLSTEIARLDIDYSQPDTNIYDGMFDSRKAQYRINVKPFEHYSLAKLIGIYAEPNLLVH